MRRRAEEAEAKLAAMQDEPPLQRGEVVVFAGGKTGTITRAYQMEDKYAVKELGAAREIRGKDDAFFYFNRADLRRAVPVGPSAVVETAPDFSMDAGGQRLDGVLTAPAVLASMQAPPLQMEPVFEPPPGPERLQGRVKWLARLSRKRPRARHLERTSSCTATKWRVALMDHMRAPS